MELLIEGFKEALHILLSLDPQVIEITKLTLKISGSATLFALIIGIPFGLFLALYRFPGRRLIASLVNTGMGLPPVVVGLFLALILWRSGPLGFLEIMYTPLAMVAAQVVIALPLVTGFTMAAIGALDPDIILQARALGASKGQSLLVVLKEARLGTLAAAMAGFGGIISEIGAVLMVGGNIKNQTRVLTTAIVLETRMGRFEAAIALSIILLVLSFSVNYALTVIQQRGSENWPRRFLK
ncbi:MAG: ABC transporter permease [Actinomycetota bacterium]|nr:ABC transporter permease [Actinomycetota bacterium]